MRLKFFDHRTLFWSPDCQFQSNCAHFSWAGSILAIVGDKIKKWTERTTSDKFYLFPNKVSALDEAQLFRSPIIVLVTKLSISMEFLLVLWAGSTLAIIGNKTKWNERTTLDKFYLFPKSIRARWGLCFSITKHCFGHQNINFSGICVILVCRLHFSYNWG